MLVYFLIGLLWPGLLFYWLLIIAPPRRTRNCPERHRGCCALFYSATTGQKLRTTASRQAVVLTLSQPRHARIDRGRRKICIRKPI